MKNPKKISAKASSAKLSPAQKAANTREAKKREIANEILRLSDENHKLKDEKSHLAAQLFDLKNKPAMDKIAYEPQPITAESLRVDLNRLELEKQQESDRLDEKISQLELEKESTNNLFDQKIAAKEAEIGDFIKKRKAEIEILS